MKDDEQDEVEKKTIKNHSIQSVAFDEHEDFNVTISEVVDGEGNPYTEDNPLGINDEFIVELNWHLINNHNYNPGDIETIELPKEIYIPEMLEDELKDDETGNVIANYKIGRASCRERWKWQNGKCST